MGIFRKPSGATAAAPINNLQVNSSANGIVIPVFGGTVRMPLWLLWNDDFKTITTTQKGGGGGIFGLSGSSSSTTTTSYQTAFLGGLAWGTINHIANVWNGSGKVQAIQITESFTVPPGGGPFTPTPPGGGGGNKPVRSVSFAQTFSQTFTDFGAPSSTVLSGTFQAPMVQVASSPGAGQFTNNPTTGVTTFGAASAGLVTQITYTVSFQTFTSMEEDTIPSGGTIQVPNSTEYAADGGVFLINPTTFAQTQMIRVTGTPATGQYTVNTTGLYTFATADHFKLVLITWQQHDPTANDATAILNFSSISGVEGQAPWSYLTSNHPDAALGYSGIATIQAAALQLGTSAEMPQLNFEVIGPYLASGGTSGQAGGNIDCNPSDILWAYLADNKFGIGFPTANMEWVLTSNNFQTSSLFAFVPFINNAGQNAAAFWAANNYFISPYIDNQTTVSAEFARILEAGQTAIIWSEGVLKLRPYGDTSAAGNGFVYQPLTQPVFDLGITDFVGGAGEDTLKVNLSSIGGKYNTVRIKFSNRLNDYESDVIQEENLASIQVNGTRPEDPQDYSDLIRAAWVAQWVANMRVKRISNIRSTYEFTVPFVYDILEPMDIVTLTHPNYGFVQKPVRITKIEDDPDKGLKITAEDFPYGIAKATLYPKQTNLDTTIAPNLQESGNATPWILELPGTLTQAQGFTYRIYAVPDSPGSWGGAQVWLSNDNVEYDLQGSITEAALLGTLSGSMALGTGDPDTGTTITVVFNNNIQLLPVSSTDFADLADGCLLAIIDASGTFEIVAYENASLTGVNTYSVSTFHRGLFGTTRASHSSGATVLKLGEGYLQDSYPSSLVGTSNYCKLTSFNTVGAREQDVNVVSSVAFNLTGTQPSFFYLAHANPDNALHVSTPLNPQGSVLPNQGILINFTLPVGMIIATWVQQSLLRTDSSTLTVNSSGGANLIINGDGEAGTLGAQEPNWTNINSGAGGTGLITANDSVWAGSFSMKITNAGSNNSANGQTISLTGGVTYVLEGLIKSTALTGGAGHGALLNMGITTGIGTFTIISKLNNYDAGQTTTPTVGLPADNVVRAFTFVQSYFIPASNGTVTLLCQNIATNAGSTWFDNIAVYPFNGAIYTGLSNSTTYKLYPYCQVATGTVGFANGSPPPTSPSDTFNQQTNLDGRFGFQPCSVLTAASGATTPGTGSGGGSGTCPESNEPVEIERYSVTGELLFAGQIKAGQVLHGYESDDGSIKRGDFLKGYSFKRQQVVYRAVLKVMLVHCNGWVIVDGRRVTPCEPVYKNGQWMPAWKAPGAAHDNSVGWKVLIQVEADWDDEHNFYVGDLLIHNSIILPC